MCPQEIIGVWIGPESRDKVTDARIGAVRFAKDNGYLIARIVAEDAGAKRNKRGVFMLGRKLVVRVKVQCHWRRVSGNGATGRSTLATSALSLAVMGKIELLYCDMEKSTHF